MYWDQDISSIAAEIYNPLSIHKGYQGDARNLSIPPRNYWRLGLGTTGGEFRDAGSDGTNHLIPRQPLEETYTTSVYGDQNYLFYPQDGVMHGMTNGSANPYGHKGWRFHLSCHALLRPEGKKDSFDHHILR